MKHPIVKSAGAALAAGALAAAAATLAVPAAQARTGSRRPPKVYVRVEGAKRTLLADTPVRPPRGLVRKDGHSCSADSVAGALNRATRGRWSGTWYASYHDWLVTSILGEKATGSNYWALFIGDVQASKGMCQIPPRAGEQILWAMVPAASTYPLALRAPSHATAGRAFVVKVIGYPNGHARALAGASVTAGSEHATTSSAGTVRLTDDRAGRLTVRADKPGYIRDEATVTVRG